MTTRSEPVKKTMPAERPFLRRVRLYGLRRLRWLHSLWHAQPSANLQGLAISEQEVERILGDPSEAIEAEAVFYLRDEVSRQLSWQISTCEGELPLDPNWSRLVNELGLSGPERDLLSLVVAVEVDPWWRRVCGYLHDDATAGQPTQWLAASLFGWPRGTRIASHGPLACWHLARPVEGAGNPGSATTPWAADPYLASWLAGNDLDDPCSRLAPPAGNGTADPCLYPELLEDLGRFLHSTHAGGEDAVEIELIGPGGGGKQTLAKQLCARLDLPLVIADAKVLGGTEVPLTLAHERAVRAVRRARLTGAALYWRSPEGVDPRVWLSLPGFAKLTFFGSSSPSSIPPIPHVTRRAARLPALTRSARASLWSRLAEGPPPEAVSGWPLTPAEISRAALAGKAGALAVGDGCREMFAPAAGDLLLPLPCPYTWDDIVLSEDIRRHLSQVESHARLRWEVLENWGFKKLTPLGSGLTALFAGPSGTGKTMGAQVIARSLGVDLYRVDLATVVNKYIGETEKRLKKLFDSCERSNVVLFFDEADALFGRRTQVKEAHDRFANIEIDYLLQRMEQFDGVAILATNRKEDLDRAFFRRLRFVIDFLLPAPAERLAIWRKTLLSHSPAGEPLLGEIKWDFLAERLELNGAEIKGAALSAAFLARAEGTVIGMQHVLSAVRRELQKKGRVPRFGDLGE
jgi:AAA+ superfamily predicted ATPase